MINHANLSKLHERVCEQRDELLAALKSVMPDGLESLCDECGGNPDKCISGCAYPIARTLIAKVEAQS